jgi:hypothetical protein
VHDPRRLLKYAGSFMAPVFNLDLQAARAFMAKHHPKVADAVESDPHQLVPTTITCR